MHNLVSTLTLFKKNFILAIDLKLLKLSGNEDMFNILNEFEFRPNLIPENRGKLPLSI